LSVRSRPSDLRDLATRLQDYVGGQLRLRLEIDRCLQFAPSVLWLSAVEELLALALASAPAESELYFGLTRPGGRLVPVGDARLTARWQVRGGMVAPQQDTIRGLRPGIRGAASVACCAAAETVVRAFEVAGWGLQLEAGREDEEIWARARRARPEC
jgi:hypothetical protein